MPIYSNGISMKPEGFKLYASRGLIYQSGGGGGLSSGAMTTTEITSTASLPGGGFDDSNFDGGYLFESSDGTGDWVICLAAGGTGTMGANPRSSILGQSIGYGLNNATYSSNWIIDGGAKRIVVLQMYYPNSPPYNGADTGKQAYVDAITWLRSQYTNADPNNKVCILASSQGGDLFRFLADDDGDVAGPLWCRNNIRLAYDAAAGLPATGPDLTGVDIRYISGDNDSTVPYGTNTIRASSINSASTGNPVTVQTIPGGGHLPWWDYPFNVDMNASVSGGDDFDGIITTLNQLYG